MFSYSIRFLKDHIMEEIKKSVIQEAAGAIDLEYVLTVPAIWGDKAKMFMREAAIGVRLSIIKGVKKFDL